MTGAHRCHAPLSHRTFARQTARVVAVALALLLMLAPRGALAASYNWPQFDGNAQHSGDNTQETAITIGNVGGLQRLFQVALPDVADGAPAYLNAVSTASGPRDLLFLATRDGHVVAVDAHSGAQVWSVQYPAGACRINNGSSPCYTTSSPAIDPSGQYVYSYGLDGYVHRLRVGDGGEVMGNGWPELATLKPFDEKGSADLSIATARSGASYLYVANGGYPGDQGDYQGHLTTINLATGAQHVFNAVCSNQVDTHFAEAPGSPDCSQVQTAIWARVGAVYDPDTDRVYVATGNGDYNPAAYDWGDSVLALNPDGTGNAGIPLDSYTPGDYQALQSYDLDLGSTAPAILPAPSGSVIRHLAVQGGKDATLRLLNLDNLSGSGGPSHTGGEVQTLPVPQGNEVLTQPAVWVNPADGSTWVFVANDNGIAGLRLTVSGTGAPSLQPVWQNGSGGTSPLVANGVLYYAGGTGIQALDPTNGNVLWQDTSIGGIHWESPIVANGVLYITDESGNLTAYALPGTSPPALTVGTVSAAPFQSVTVTGTNFGATETVALYWDGGGTPLATATTSNGSFVATIHVPQAAYGAHTISAAGVSSHLAATASVRVKPELLVLPTSGAAGTRVVVIGFGFAAGERVALYWDKPLQLLGTLTGNAVGTGVTLATIPAGASASLHLVYGVGQTSHALGVGVFVVK